MSDARLVGRQDLVVQLDYSTFYLHTADLEATQVVEVAQRAAASAGVAQSNGLLVIESPEQYNFDMGLTIEIWDEQPTDDLRAWSDAFEAHLDVGTGGLTYESPTLDRVSIDVPSGSYHALITGRGYNDGDDPTAPGGSWRI